MAKHNANHNAKTTDRGRARRTHWGKTYRKRIADGLEFCRKCAIVSTDLTFDHIIPYVMGGRLKFDNTTILCRPCNERKGCKTNWDLISFLEEETNAPIGRRWAADSYHSHTDFCYLEFMNREKENTMVKKQNQTPVTETVDRLEVTITQDLEVRRNGHPVVGAQVVEYVKNEGARTPTGGKFTSERVTVLINRKRPSQGRPAGREVWVGQIPKGSRVVKLRPAPFPYPRPVTAIDEENV